MVSMAKPVTKYAVQVRDPKNIVRELNLAWQIANTGRKGPVLIRSSHERAERRGGRSGL